MLFDVNPFLIFRVESVPFFHGCFEKARGLNCHHGLIYHLLLSILGLGHECYDVALLEPLEEELFDGVLRIPVS